MAEITAANVGKLREMTGAGLMDCKKALVETKGDIEAAVEYLRKKGIASAEKKAGRAANEGVIAQHIAPGAKVGVLVEINCETDFVAKNEAFRDFVKDITLHIAASSPICVSRESVPATLVAREREIAADQVKGKPANIVEKIVEGKIDKYFASVCLLDQAFIKNPDQTVSDLVKSKIAELGENIVIRRFTRYMVGEALEVEQTPAVVAE